MIKGATSESKAASKAASKSAAVQLSILKIKKAYRNTLFDQNVANFFQV